MKVKITAGKDLKFIFPIQNPDQKVGELIEEIKKRARLLLGFSSDENSVEFLELRSNDSFLINSFDIISSVISDGDHLLLVDKKTLFDEKLQKMQRATIKISRNDVNDGSYKHLSIGMHSNNHFYILCEENRLPLRIDTFSYNDLIFFPKSGKHLIYERRGGEGEKEWKVQTFFVVNEGDNFVSEIELSLSSSSDPRPEIKRVEIEYEQSKIKLGKVKEIQSAEIDLWKENFDREIAKDEIISINQTITITNDLPLLSSSNYSSFSGEIPLKITQCDDVFVNQSWISSEGFFDVLFAVNFNVINNGEKAVIISSASAYYLDPILLLNQKSDRDLDLNSPSIWKKGNIKMGRKEGYARYNWSNSPNIVIPNESQSEISLGIIVINNSGPQGDQIRRSPNHLGQPFIFKFLLEDANLGVSTVICRQINGKIELIERGDEKFDFWFAFDDRNTETRHVFSITKKGGEGKEYLDVVYKRGSSKFLNYDELSSIAYKAVQSNISLVPLDELSLRDKHYSIQQEVWAMVDLEKKYVYALKIENKNTEFSEVRHFKIPPRF